jgi:putative ABC transport system ATP-binding protein
MRDDELVELRRHTVAFIFQAFGLVPILSAAENVECRPARHADPTMRDRRAGSCRAVGLATRRPPTARAVGRRAARVAIARKPWRTTPGSLADELTGH